MGLFTIEHSTINLNDDNFNEDDCETIFDVRLRLDVIDLNKLKHIKEISVLKMVKKVVE